MMGSKGSATISALSAFQRMVMMMRIIDAHLVQEIADREIGGETASLIQYVLSHTPTIEAEPVRHGRWIERLDGDGEFVHHMCSECKADAFFQYIIEADWDENIDGEWYNRGDEITGIEEFLTDYCPHCGARMDGDDDATN